MVNFLNLFGLHLYNTFIRISFLKVEAGGMQVFSAIVY